MKKLYIWTLWLGIPAVILIIITIAIVVSRDDGEGIRAITAERGDVVQEVAVTGNLVAKASADLGFEITGSVTDIYTTIGATVSEGDELIRIDTRAAQLQLSASVALRSSGQGQTKLTWDNAENAWEDTKATNSSTVEKKRQAVRDAKVELDQAKEVWLQTDRESGDSATSETALKTFRTAESVYHAAQKSLTETLASTVADTQDARATADEAREKYLATVQTSGRVSGLSSLQADEALANLQLTKGTLRAPFDGVVTTLSADIGDLLSANTLVVSVATVDQVELQADVPETDAIKLIVGQSATITFDAKPPTQTWEAKVTRVAPAATIIEGVPTYEVILELTTPDASLPPGLTANINIHTDQRSKVIAIPRRAVIRRGQEEFVRLLADDGTTTERSITTGLVGSVGTVEILSGLDGGEQVVIQMP